MPRDEQIKIPYPIGRFTNKFVANLINKSRFESSIFTMDAVRLSNNALCSYFRDLGALKTCFFVRNHVFDPNIWYGLIFGDKNPPEAVSTRSPRWVVDDPTDQFPTLDYIVPNPEYIVSNLDYILAKMPSLRLNYCLWNYFKPWP